jgi:Tfp pilus assembly protein PilF/mono/diheme cytochrome c family protein
MIRVLRALPLCPVALILGLAAASLLGAPSQEPANSSAKTESTTRPAQPSPGPDTSGGVTFDRNIAPVIFQNCAPCHRPGEAGPFPLLTYEDVKKHARQIAFVTHARLMPPWLPEPQPLKFADERRLSDAQLDLIGKWVDGGMVEGNAAELPRPPRFTEGWQLGEPDLIVKAAKPFVLPASGNDVYWNFILPVPINETRWVRAVEIRPGDKRLVHHANILVDRLGLARRIEKEPGGGFAGMDLRIESEVFDPDSHFLFWKPGSAPYVEPDGLALRLDKGTDLVLNSHFQPSGKPELVQPSVGIYFTDKPATQFPMLLQLDRDTLLDIPPGEKDFTVIDSFMLPVDADLLAIYPHAHYLGKDLLAEATLPDGKSETLIHIRHWDLNWQAVFRYTQPVSLPKGTTISMRYVYNNSEENLANPSQPPQRVRAGNGATDEMAHLSLQVLPRTHDLSQPDPRRVLQEALARHHVEQDPSDYAAHYNLGAMLQARGDIFGAIAHYDRASQNRPDDAVIHNALGSALLSVGNAPDAILHFGAALKLRPDYFDAHYNLGIALASQEDFKAALTQFQEAARLNPDDANAQANLGSSLAQTGKLIEAKSCFERALKIDPGHQFARENLDAVNGMIAQQPH